VTYAPPVVEPRDADQPAGTSIVLAFRGATAVGASDAAPQPKDAANYDFYGDPNPTLVPNQTPFSVTYFNNDSKWKSNLGDVNGAKWFQVRMTFVANTETNLFATASALGFAFKSP
jgi:hypothetical protein